MSKIYCGDWYFHELKKTFYGELEYTDVGWILSINCPLALAKKTEKTTLITGKIEDENIIILNAELFGMVEYKGETIIKGKTFEKEEDIKFKRIYVEFKNLHNWSGFENIIIKRNSENIFSIEKNNCQEKDNKSIVFDFNEKMSLSSVIQEIEEIISLFQIIYGNPIYISKIIELDTDSEIILNGYEEYEESKTEKELIKYDDIKDSISNILNVYNQNKSKFLDILKILIELNNKKESIAIEIQFLLVVQGLESFSRRFRIFEENESLEDAIDQLCNNIKDENTSKLIKEELLKIDDIILRDRILVNEVTLSKRLRKLLKESSIASDLNSDKIGSLVHKIAKNRNYHTHLYELNDERDIFDIDSFLYITRFLNIVLLELILDELGIEKRLFFRKINNKHIINKIVNREVY